MRLDKKKKKKKNSWNEKIVLNGTYSITTLSFKNALTNVWLRQHQWRYHQHINSLKDKTNEPQNSDGQKVEHLYSHRWYYLPKSRKILLVESAMLGFGVRKAAEGIQNPFFIIIFLFRTHKQLQWRAMMRLPHYGSSYNTLHLQFITINSNYRLLNFKKVRRLGGLFFLGTRVISPFLCVIDKYPFV